MRGWQCSRRLWVFSLALCVCLAFTSNALATTYYVDSVGGNDNWDGTSPATAWHNLTKVNTVVLVTRPWNRPDDPLRLVRACRDSDYSRDK